MQLTLGASQPRDTPTRGSQQRSTLPAQSKLVAKSSNGWDAERELTTNQSVKSLKKTVHRSGVVKHSVETEAKTKKTNSPRTRLTSTRDSRPSPKIPRVSKAGELSNFVHRCCPLKRSKDLAWTTDGRRCRCIVFVVLVGSIGVVPDGHHTDCHRNGYFKSRCNLTRKCRLQGPLSFSTSLENCWPRMCRRKSRQTRGRN